MNASAALSTLKITAALAALLAVVQSVLGFGMGGHAPHGMLGNLTFVVTLIATIAAFLWFRRSGDKGLLMHAGGMTVLTLAQVALGEAHQILVHQILGVLILVGLVALATLSFRRTPAMIDARTDARLD